MCSPGRRLEQVEREIRGKYAAHAVALAGLGKGHLTIYDDVFTALHGGDDDVHAMRRTVERLVIG